MHRCRWQIVIPWDECRICPQSSTTNGTGFHLWCSVSPWSLWMPTVFGPFQKAHQIHKSSIYWQLFWFMAYGSDSKRSCSYVLFFGEIFPSPHAFRNTPGQICALRAQNIYPTDLLPQQRGSQHDTPEWLRGPRTWWAWLDLELAHQKSQLLQIHLLDIGNADQPNQPQWSACDERCLIWDRWVRLLWTNYCWLVWTVSLFWITRFKAREHMW